MQNKGIVICVAVLLTLASIFYLSFSFATRYYDSEAAKIKDPIAQQDYKDSVKYLGVYSYQNCLETQIGLGLDLKGGMNVILEISVPDVIENLADHKTDAGFTNATNKEATDEYHSSNDSYGEGSLVHRHELVLLALHQVVRNSSIKLAVHPLVVIQLVVVNQTSQEYGCEE